MSRQYVRSDQVSNVGTSGELASLKYNGSGIAEIEEVVVQELDTTLAGPQDLALSYYRFSSGPTQNTSGTLVTAQKLDQGDTASNTTIYSGNTGQTTSGSLVESITDSTYLYQGSNPPAVKGMQLQNGDIFSITQDTSLPGVTALAVTIKWKETGL